MSAPAGYRLRWADATDTEELAALADRAHGTDEPDGRAPWVADGVRASLSPDHPSVVRTVFAEHVATGRAAAMASIIPQTWTVGGHPVRVGRLESFATHPDHRRRGLVGAVIDQLHTEADDLGCHLTVISGLPWFYRRYGYEYALSHEGGWGVVWPDDLPTAEIRPLAADDIDAAQALEATLASDSHVWCRRTLDHWKAALDGAIVDGADGSETTHALTAGGALSGYVTARRRTAGGALVVTELALADPGAFGPGLIAALRPLAGAGTLGVYLQLGADHPVYAAWPDGCDLPIRPSAWYVRVPDWSTVFRAVPTGFGDHTGELWLSEYVEGVRLDLDRGRVVAAAAWDPTRDRAPHTAAFPPGTLAKLVLGYRSLDQLLDAYPDVELDEGPAELLRRAFPPRPSHLRPLQ